MSPAASADRCSAETAASAETGSVAESVSVPDVTSVPGLASEAIRSPGAADSTGTASTATDGRESTVSRPATERRHRQLISTSPFASTAHLVTTGHTVDLSPQEIIASARRAPATFWSALGCGSLTAVLLWSAFPPLDLGPLAWIAMIPVLLLARIERPTSRMSLALWISGFLFWLPTLQWLRLGDPTMYPAWIALSLYLAAYFPISIGLMRYAVHHWHCPLAIAAPVIWAGLELFRAHFLTGFAWYYLGHTQHGWTSFIQICDLTGVYGVSFVMILVQALAAELIPTLWLARCQLLPPALTMQDALLKAADQQRTNNWYLRRTAIGAATVLAVIGYGLWQRSGATFPAGPRVAAVQGNFRAVVNPNPADGPRIHQRYKLLTGQAVKQQPDFIVWPEGMFRWPLLATTPGVTNEHLSAVNPQMNFEWLQNLQVEKSLADMSQMANAAMFVNLTTVWSDGQKLKYYNSSVFVRPDVGLVNRYDKIHRVPFGEYIPATDWLPFLTWFAPFGEEFGIAAGEAPVACEFKGYRATPLICYEDTVPQVVRQIVLATRQPQPNGQEGRVHLLVNMSNDGWFDGSSEHDQHLITAQFRCIEMRTPMVRAVNSGISAIIDGDGVVRRKAEDLETKQSKLVEAVVVDNVPLDGRFSLYLEWGDWFGGLCLTLTALLLAHRILFWLQSRFQRRSGSPVTTPLLVPVAP